MNVTFLLKLVTLVRLITAAQTKRAARINSLPLSVRMLAEGQRSSSEATHRRIPAASPSSQPSAAPLCDAAHIGVEVCYSTCTRANPLLFSPPASAPDSLCLLALSSTASNYFCILNQCTPNDADVLHERDPLKHPLPSIFINLDMVLTAQQCQIYCREQFAKNICWMICFYLPTTSLIMVRLFPCCHK